MCDWTSIFLILVRFSFAVQFFFVVVAFSLEKCIEKSKAKLNLILITNPTVFHPRFAVCFRCFGFGMCVCIFLALYCCVSVNWCYSCYRLTLYHTTPHTLYHRLRVNTLYHSVSARFSVWLFFTPYTVYDNIFFGSLTFAPITFQIYNVIFILLCFRIFFFHRSHQPFYFCMHFVWCNKVIIIFIVWCLNKIAWEME